MSVDRLLRADIINEVHRSMNKALECAHEEWVSGDRLCELFACFSKAWLKSYGESLPRQRAVVIMQDGSERKSGWCYPRFTIARMIADGGITRLRMREEVEE